MIKLRPWKTLWGTHLADFDDSGHRGAAKVGDAPATGPGDLGDVAMSVQAIEEAGDAGSVATSEDGIVGRSEESLADVAVAEASDDVLPAQDSGEEPSVVRIGGVEAAVTTRSLANGCGHPVENLAGRGRIGDAGQALEVPGVGGAADALVSIEEGDAFRHRIPAYSDLTPKTRHAAHLELAGLIDGRFDPENAAVAVVHFDPVALDPMLDAHPLRTTLDVADDLALEIGVEFPAEEAHHILGAEGRRRVSTRAGYRASSAARLRNMMSVAYSAWSVTQ